MGIVITLVIFVIGGWFLWTKVIQPQMSGKYGEMAIEAQKEFEENKAALFEEAFSNPDKFGTFNKIIPPEEEKIAAIASYLEPKSIGKNLLGEAATAITRVRKVNMSLFYLILTDKNLHSVAYNGENTVSHDIFDLDGIREVKIQKGGSSVASGMKDALAGVQGGQQYDKLAFSYKEKKYEFNVQHFVEGYPIFEVRKDVMSETFYRIYKANAGSESTGTKYYQSKEFYADSMFRTSLYTDFQKAFGERFDVQFPA